MNPNPKQKALQTKKEYKKLPKRSEVFGGNFDSNRLRKDLKKSISHRIKHF